MSDVEPMSETELNTTEQGMVDALVMLRTHVPEFVLCIRGTEADKHGWMVMCGIDVSPPAAMRQRSVLLREAGWQLSDVRYAGICAGIGHERETHREAF